MDDLCQEVALRKLNAPPRDPPLAPWGNPVGNGDSKMADQEVTFPRGGGGYPEDNHHDPLPPQPDKDVECLINTLATGL